MRFYKKFTEFTHFRVRVWRIARCSSRRRRTIVSTFCGKDSPFYSISMFISVIQYVLLQGAYQRKGKHSKS